MSNNTSQNGASATGNSNTNNTHAQPQDTNISGISPSSDSDRDGNVPQNPRPSSPHSTLPDYETPSPTNSTSSHLARSFTNSDISDPSYNLDDRMRALMQAKRAALLQMFRGTPQLRTVDHLEQLNEMGDRAIDIAYANNLSFREGWAQIVYEARLEEAQRIYRRWIFRQTLQGLIADRQLEMEHDGLIANSSLGMLPRDVSPSVSPVSSNGEVEMEDLEDLVIRMHPPPRVRSDSDMDTDSNSSDEDEEEVYTYDDYLIDLYRSLR